MNDEKHKNYLRDLGFFVRELAQEAKSDSLEAKGSESESFQSGYLMAFHRVVSLMQRQADVFQLPLEEIHLDGIDPERDLLSTSDPA